MKKRMKEIWLGLLVGGIALVLIGSICAPAVPAAEKKVLRVAQSSFGTEQFDPARESTTNCQANLQQMYDSLLWIAPDGGLAPGIAKSWEMSKDGLSWTFHLRNGVKFHEGWGEVTAEDVKFSIERFMDPKCFSNLTASLRAGVKEVEIVDKYTVRVHTNKLMLDLPQYLSPHQAVEGMVFCKAYLLQKAGKDFVAQMNLINQHPIGSGPYKFVEHKRADHFTFEAVKDHWRNTPQFDRLEIVLVPEMATQVSMLKAGEVDIIEVSGDTAFEVQKAGFEVRGIPYSLEPSLAFVGTHWPMALEKDMPATKTKVREALSLAINRKEIIETILAGRAQLPVAPFPLGPFTADIDVGYWRNRSTEAYRYDPKRAKELLVEAGYPQGFSGIKLFSYTRPGSPWIPNINEAIVGYWADIGVKAEIVPIDYGAWRPHWVNAVNDPLSAGNANTLSAMVQYVPVLPLNNYYDKNSDLKLLNEPELDKHADEAPAVIDKAKRMEIIRQAWVIVEKSYVFPPIAAVDALYGVNPKKVGKWQTIMGKGTLGVVYETIEAK